MNTATAMLSDSTDIMPTFRKRVAEDLQLLAVLHDREPDKSLLQELRKVEFPDCLTLLPDTEPGKDAMAQMQQGLSSLSVEPDLDTLNELAADYASIYLNHAISASPAESVWIDEDSLMCQTSMFQVRSWYETYGLGIPDWRLRPDDHLVYQLQFLSRLLDKDDQMETLRLMARFMDEHLLRWLGNFAERVVTRCATPYFAGAAAVTATYCEQLRDILAELLEESRPTREEIDERMQPVGVQAEEMPVQFMPGIGPAV